MSPVSRVKRWGCGLVAGGAILSLIGCSTPAPVSSPTNNIVEPAVRFPETPPPTRIVVLVDLSGSRLEHRVQMPETEAFESVLAALLESGGTFAVGTICDDSNYPLARLTIAEPLPLPIEQLHLSNPPEEIDASTVNRLRLPELQREFDEAMAVHKRLQAEDEAVLAGHQQRLAEHRASGQKLIQDFLKQEIAPILNSPANCANTDIWGGLQRANLVLTEDSSVWATPPELYLVVVSDGLDTQGSPKTALPKNLELLLVNGSASQGIFADIDHAAFESVDAALSTLVHLITVRSQADAAK